MLCEQSPRPNVRHFAEPPDDVSDAACDFPYGEVLVTISVGSADFGAYMNLDV